MIYPLFCFCALTVMSVLAEPECLLLQGKVSIGWIGSPFANPNEICTCSLKNEIPGLICTAKGMLTRRLRDDDVGDLEDPKDSTLIIALSVIGGVGILIVVGFLLLRKALMKKKTEEQVDLQLPASSTSVNIKKKPSSKNYDDHLPSRQSNILLSDHLPSPRIHPCPANQGNKKKPVKYIPGGEDPTPRFRKKKDQLVARTRQVSERDQFPSRQSNIRLGDHLPSPQIHPYPANQGNRNKPVKYNPGGEDPTARPRKKDKVPPKEESRKSWYKQRKTEAFPLILEKFG